VQKEIRRGGVPTSQFLQPDGEHRLILLHVIAADKPDHWVCAVTMAWTGTFGFLR
jgi:hypothetical protein